MIAQVPNLLRPAFNDLSAVYRITVDRLLPEGGFRQKPSGGGRAVVLHVFQITACSVNGIYGLLNQTGAAPALRLFQPPGGGDLTLLLQSKHPVIRSPGDMPGKTIPGQITNLPDQLVILVQAGLDDFLVNTGGIGVGDQRLTSHQDLADAAE